MKDDQDDDTNFASKRIRSKLDNIYEKLGKKFFYLSINFIKVSKEEMKEFKMEIKGELI